METDRLVFNNETGSSPVELLVNRRSGRLGDWSILKKISRFSLDFLAFSSNGIGSASEMRPGVGFSFLEHYTSIYPWLRSISIFSIPQTLAASESSVFGYNRPPSYEGARRIGEGIYRWSQCCWEKYKVLKMSKVLTMNWEVHDYGFTEVGDVTDVWAIRCQWHDTMRKQSKEMTIDVRCTLVYTDSRSATSLALSHSFNALYRLIKLRYHLESLDAPAPLP